MILENIKSGYIEMYPPLEFEGSIKTNKIQENRMETAINTAFFSGGVDAFNTLVCHADEKPMLITLWGADIKLDDTNRWWHGFQHGIGIICHMAPLSYNL